MKLSHRVIKLNLIRWGDFEENAIVKSLLLNMKALQNVWFSVPDLKMKHTASELLQRLAPSLKQLGIKRGFMPALSNFKFNSLTEVSVNITTGREDISQLLINGKHTIKDLTLTLGFTSNPGFIQHMGELRQLRTMWLDGGDSGSFRKLPDLLNACGKSLQNLTLDGFNHFDMVEAELTMNLRYVNSLLPFAMNFMFFNYSAQGCRAGVETKRLWLLDFRSRNRHPGAVTAPRAVLR